MSSGIVSDNIFYLKDMGWKIAENYISDPDRNVYFYRGMLLSECGEKYLDEYNDISDTEKKSILIWALSGK
jgi:hypothetical protein